MVGSHLSNRQLQQNTSWHPLSLCEKEAKAFAVHRTDKGVLLEGDCLEILPYIHSNSIDLVFADPPFNLAKNYGQTVNDRLSDAEYVQWCRLWMDHCTRVLKPGGSFFLYNLPKWNIILGNSLAEKGMTFRHWIAVSIKLSLPIPGRLYPAHYSLLYFTKGKPKTFRRVRTPIATCRHCGGEIRDYGGHRSAMNPKGVNLTDVWDDIAPVRNWKFKSGKRLANQVPTNPFGPTLQVSTNEYDMVL